MHRHIRTGLRKRFEHCRTHSSVNHTVFDCDDRNVHRDDTINDFLIHRLKEYHIIVGNGDAEFLFRTVDRLSCLRSYRSDGKHHHVAAVLEQFALADRQFVHLFRQFRVSVPRG